MLMVVTWIGFLIHVYSIGYMSHEEGYWRYFAYLNLFLAAMLILVLGSSYLFMFVGWEGVGLCSYLLIGFYYKTDYAPAAGKKAFIVNRIGDFGFLVAMFLMFAYIGSVDFAKVSQVAGAGGLSAEHRHRDLPPALPRRDRQVRADSALRLAARRHGRPDAGLRAHPRRDDGHRRRLHDRPLERALPPLADGDDGRRRHRRR